MKGLSNYWSLGDLTDTFNGNLSNDYLYKYYLLLNLCIVIYLDILISADIHKILIAIFYQEKFNLFNELNITNN